MTDQIIHRDTITGQTVTAEYAKAHPDTTVRETRKAGKWRRRAEAAEAKLEAVRALHHRHLHRDPSIINGPWYCCGSVQLGTIAEGDCDECRDSWPCPTIRAIDGTEGADR